MNSTICEPHPLHLQETTPISAWLTLLALAAALCCNACCHGCAHSDPAEFDIHILDPHEGQIFDTSDTVKLVAEGESDHVRDTGWNASSGEKAAWFWKREMIATGLVTSATGLAPGYEDLWVAVSEGDPCRADSVRIRVGSPDDWETTDTGDWIVCDEDLP